MGTKRLQRGGDALDPFLSTIISPIMAAAPPPVSPKPGKSQERPAAGWGRGPVHKCGFLLLQKVPHGWKAELPPLRFQARGLLWKLLGTWLVPGPNLAGLFSSAGQREGNLFAAYLPPSQTQLGGASPTQEVLHVPLNDPRVHLTATSGRTEGGGSLSEAVSLKGRHHLRQ